MKLLSIKQNNNFFIIVTDQGERQVSLSWKSIDNIRQKALTHLGKEIEISWYFHKFCESYIYFLTLRWLTIIYYLVK